MYYILAHQQARDNAARACQTAPEGYEVRITAPNKTRAQEEHYHAIFTEAAKKCKHLNEQLDVEAWKRLMIDQFSRDMLQDPQTSQTIRDNLKNAVKMMPSLDGKAIVAVGLQSRQFKKETASAFIGWLNAYLAEKV